MRISFVTDQLELNDVVWWLAETIYPHEEPDAARKKVRARIRYAAKIGKTHITDKGTKEFVETLPFFSWAVTKWPALYAIDGFPLDLSPATASLSLPPIHCEGVAVSIPHDIEQLKKDYIAAETERHQLSAENTQLRTLVDELQAELTAWREKDAATRQKKSKAGTKGGRGNIAV